MKQAQSSRKRIAAMLGYVLWGYILVIIGVIVYNMLLQSLVFAL